MKCNNKLLNISNMGKKVQYIKLLLQRIFLNKIAQTFSCRQIHQVSTAEAW